jgi:regulatory protein
MLDSATLERLAIRYVERYATTRAKLTRYLERKLYERGWQEIDPPPVTDLIERIVRLGYVDDLQFGQARAATLARRGYGARRIGMALRAAGIDHDKAGEILADAEEGARDAALTFARRHKMGPFARAAPDDRQRSKFFAAMMRAGHPLALVREILSLEPEDNSSDGPKLG